MGGIFLFIFASLLAASIDACLRGFLLGKIAIKYRFVDYFKIFIIIFLVCALACFLGDEINQIYSRRYLNIIGGFLMLFLSASSFNGMYVSCFQRVRYTFCKFFLGAVSYFNALGGSCGF